MAIQLRSRLTPAITRLAPPVGAAALGTTVALLALVIPGAWLEGAVSGSGLPALLPVAAPPLGGTARVLLALGGGAVVAAVAWAALYLLFGPGGPLAMRTVTRTAPTVRRADAHPDAPPRWPLTAAELASPTVPVATEPLPEAEQPLPADLDVPLAQFDPAAVLPVPREPARALKPLAPALEPGERMETFKLTPPPPPVQPEPSDEPPSIDALLRRLEAGAARRVRAG